MTRPLSEAHAELQLCAAAWEPDVRLLGNVTALEIECLMNELATLREQVKSTDRACEAAIAGNSLSTQRAREAERKLEAVANGLDDMIRWSREAIEIVTTDDDSMCDALEPEEVADRLKHLRALLEPPTTVAWDIRTDPPTLVPTTEAKPKPTDMSTEPCPGCGKLSRIWTAGCDHCDHEDK